MRSIKRGPGKAIQFIKKYIKSKWSDDDIIIFTFITCLTLSPMVWFLYNLSTLAWAGALYTNLLEDLFLMEYTWYDMDVQFKRLKMFDSLKDNENQ